MTLKVDAKFKGKLIRGLKNDIRYFVNFHVSNRKSENLHFDELFLSNAYKGLDEKVRKSCASWHWRVMQSLKKNWLLVPKMTWGIWWILMWVVTSLKIWTLMCYFCQKYIMVELKMGRGVMCHNTEEWCKIWGATDMVFEKWHGFDEFRLNTQKSQNLHFNVLFLTEVNNVWAKKLQRSFVSWHGKVMQYLKKNWLVVWRLT